jgi:hypothetical protein
VLQHVVDEVHAAEVEALEAWSQMCQGVKRISKHSVTDHADVGNAVSWKLEQEAEVRR